MKALLPEQVVQKAFDRLGDIAAVPPVRSDPIADLAGAVRFIEGEDDADQASRLLSADRKQIFVVQDRAEIHLIRRLRIAADKGFQHFFVVGNVMKIVLSVLFPHAVHDQPFRFHASSSPNRHRALFTLLSPSFRRYEKSTPPLAKCSLAQKGGFELTASISIRLFGASKV